MISRSAFVLVGRPVCRFLLIAKFSLSITELAFCLKSIINLSIEPIANHQLECDPASNPHILFWLL